jgi:hypothetical protein
MVLYTHDNRAVEVTFDNFSFVKGEGAPGLIVVRFKDGTEEALKATTEEIVKAVNDSARIRQ